ncbi:hypothetical protein, partial [Helicobacter ailurogastricus]
PPPQQQQVIKGFLNNLANISTDVTNASLGSVESLGKNVIPLTSLTLSNILSDFSTENQAADSVFNVMNSASLGVAGTIGRIKGAIDVLEGHLSIALAPQATQLSHIIALLAGDLTNYTKIDATVSNAAATLANDSPLLSDLGKLVDAYGKASTQINNADNAAQTLNINIGISGIPALYPSQNGNQSNASSATTEASNLVNSLNTLATNVGNTYTGLQTIDSQAKQTAGYLQTIVSAYDNALNVFTKIGAFAVSGLKEVQRDEAVLATTKKGTEANLIATHNLKLVLANTGAEIAALQATEEEITKSDIQTQLSTAVADIASLNQDLGIAKYTLTQNATGTGTYPGVITYANNLKTAATNVTNAINATKAALINACGQGVECQTSSSSSSGSGSSSNNGKTTSGSSPDKTTSNPNSSKTTSSPKNTNNHNSNSGNSGKTTSNSSPNNGAPNTNNSGTPLQNLINSIIDQELHGPGPVQSAILHYIDQEAQTIVQTTSAIISSLDNVSAQQAVQNIVAGLENYASDPENNLVGNPEIPQDFKTEVANFIQNMQAQDINLELMQLNLDSLISQASQMRVELLDNLASSVNAQNLSSFASFVALPAKLDLSPDQAQNTQQAVQGLNNLLIYLNAAKNKMLAYAKESPEEFLARAGGIALPNQTTNSNANMYGIDVQVGYKQYLWQKEKMGFALLWQF